MFPPAYASSFAKPVIGVVTKSDIANEQQIQRAVLYLENAGATDIYITSSVEGFGFDKLIKYLNYD